MRTMKFGILLTSFEKQQQLTYLKRMPGNVRNRVFFNLGSVAASKIAFELNCCEYRLSKRIYRISNPWSTLE